MSDFNIKDLAQLLTPPNQAVVRDPVPTPAVTEEQVRASTQQNSSQEPPDKRIWDFFFSFTDSRGSLLEGMFRHTIPALGDKVAISRTAASLRNGLPVSAFEFDDLEDQRKLAYLINCLDKNFRPDWAKDLAKLETSEVIDELYAKTEAHTNKYFRRGQYSPKGS